MPTKSSSFSSSFSFSNASTTDDEDEFDDEDDCGRILPSPAAFVQSEPFSRSPTLRPAQKRLDKEPPPSYCLTQKWLIRRA